MDERRMLKRIAATTALSIVGSFGCGNEIAPAVHEEVKREQVLPLTFGGFLKDGPKAEKIDGVCGADDTRNLLNCDIYNGLPGWTVTEVTLVVLLAPYGEDDSRYYQVPIIIKPRTTEHVAVRLGLQLPPDYFREPDGKVSAFARWSWDIEGAKGYPTK
jgi:hypothetical protein